MTMQSIFGRFSNLSDLGNWSSTFGAPAIGTGTDRAAYVFQIPKTGTVSELAFCIHTVTVAQDISVGLYKVLDTGFPDFANKYSDSVIQGTITGAYATGMHETTDFGDTAVTQGDIVALVVFFTNTGTTTGDIALRAYASNSGGTNGPSYFGYNGTSWVKTNAYRPVLSLKYDDGSYAVPIGAFPPGTGNVGVLQLGSDTNPDEQGIKFEPPVKMRLHGLVWDIREFGTNLTDYKVTLYDAADVALGYFTGGGVTANVHSHHELMAGALNDGTFLTIDTPVVLTANNTYRIAIAPQTTDQLWLDQFVIDDANQKEGWGFSTWCQGTHRVNGGSWVNDEKIPQMAVYFDQLDDGASGNAYLRGANSLIRR